MKILLIIVSVLFLFGCQQASDKSMNSSEKIKDPHSFSNPSRAIVKHLDLNITVDFSKHQLTGKASWTVTNLDDVAHVIFDTRHMQIQKVTLGKDEKETKFSIGKEQAILGQSLTVDIDTGTSVVNIYYTTSKDAAALQWLTPQQTAGKKTPFLFTQSQAILARTWVPCQDGPAVRFTYNATVQVPKDLLALMSAENPQTKNETGVYYFKQTHPIPSYLLALAVGDLGFKAVDERTGVYAEPSVLEKAAWEFTDMGKMVKAAEGLYGPYRWGRYDVLVLPPSFPFGGMENPNLTFATPTVIAGDRSLVSLIAHELAHSWSGNLVTNATWNDFWLNEGFTNYFERRIIEEIYGKEEAQTQEALGRQDLENTITELGATSADTKLKLDLSGRDPDEGMNDIAYEKGAAFLRTIEEAVGREKFDSFVKNYFNKYAFQSATTETFLRYLNETLAPSVPSFDEKVKTKEWIYNAGIPNNIPPAISKEFQRIDSILSKWKRDKQAAGLSKSIRSTNQLLYFIRQLPDNISIDEMNAIDEEFHFTESGNAEIQTAWYTSAIRNNYKIANPFIEKFLVEVGRRKFLKPLYTEMIKTPEGKEWARKVYAKARPNYHPVSYTSIDQLLK